MTDKRQTAPSEGLDALLDDALDAFDATETVSTSEPSTSQQTSAVDQSTNISIEHAAPPPRAPPSGPRGLAFDPLAGGGAARRRAQQQGPSLGAGGPNLPALDDTEGLEDLSAGLSQLLAELSKAHLPADEGATPEEDAGQAADAGPVPSTEGLAATLRALADHQPAFSGSNEGEDLPEDFLEKIAAQLRGLEGLEGLLGEEGNTGGPAAGRGGAAGEAPSGDFPGMASLVDTIMHQLLSKEVLYQPMKDIGGKYPAWLAANKDSLSPEQVQQYEEQYEYIQKICTMYETDPQNYPKLMELLQEMQQRGQPPQEIIDELAPGMAFGPDGLPTGIPGGGGNGNDGPMDPSECSLQ